MTNPPPTPPYLDPSPLGTKEYWDTLYSTDLHTRSALPSHAGQTWFEDSSAEEKTLAFLDENADALGLGRETSCFLDLGTGNASMLVALREDGWTGGDVGLWGCDYSDQSVELGRRVVRGLGRGGDGDGYEGGDADEGEGGVGNGAGDESRNERLPPIHLLRHDIFQPPPAEFPASGFDVVLDKGTFDAISLSAEPLPSGERMCEGYVEAVLPLVRKGGGLLQITSCNWTEPELRRWTESERAGGELEVVGRVRYPSFSFGGQKGSTLVGVCWRRR
ncbi:MAG: hypothetical protein MMC23_002617 [Stictis urceolatum]|nr:hypothetical protein [Stictis urceolata]